MIFPKLSYKKIFPMFDIKLELKKYLNKLLIGVVRNNNYLVNSMNRYLISLNR